MSRKKQATNWQEVNSRIFAALDMPSEFASLGINLVDSEPRANGAMECHAIDREDSSASAAVFPASGRYKDSGGQGLSLSFWDLAVHQKRFQRWTEARDHYAAKAGIAINPDIRNPAQHLAFLNWSDGLVSLWCRHKPGVSIESLKANGARLARYRDQYTTICLPVFGSRFTSGDPVGFVLYNSTGRDLPVFYGKGKPPTWAKMKTTGGSEGGLIGQHAIDRLTAIDADPARQIVWKVEGPSDLLALWSIISSDKRDRHLVITNSGGAQQEPLGWMQSVFAGRLVAIVGDADTPGQLGAAKWAAWAAKVASEVRVIRPDQMGFEATDTHGLDLRNWITA